MSLFIGRRYIPRGKRRDDMKVVLFITILAISLIPGVSSFAATHGGVGAGDNLQPTQPSDIMIVPSEFAAKENLETLLQKLKDPDPFVRVEAVQALGEIQKEQSLISVCDCLNDENIYVRAYAAEALGKIGKLDISLTLLRLLPALDDPSPYVRAMMLAALGELQDERAAPSIRKLLHDEDESVRGMAAWALENIENSQQ
jgi:HEAT repeat protein